MTTPHDLYLEALERGLQLEPAGDKLAVLPKGRCPAEFIEILRQHKAELLKWLSREPCAGWQAVPPDDLPLNASAPKPTPQDRERVIAYLLRQTRERPGALAAWLMRREHAYFDGPGQTWDCGSICYAAARDVACWQLQRDESEMTQTIAGFEESYDRRSKF